MASVELSETEWSTVLSFMAYAPARECMPLINKIGAQVATAALRERERGEREAGLPPAQQGNSQEAHDGQ